MNTPTVIAQSIRARYPIYLLGPEEGRMETQLFNIVSTLHEQCADQTPFGLQAWSCTGGRIDALNDTQIVEDEDQLAVLAAIPSLPPRTVLVLRDYHMFLAEPDAVLYRKLKEALKAARSEGITIIIEAPVYKLPPELEKSFLLIEFGLPDKTELRTVLEALCTKNEYKMPKGALLEAVLDAARGMTTNEAEDAFSLSWIAEKKFLPTLISKQKCNIVKKAGVVEIVENELTLADVAGLENLIESLVLEKDNFTQEAVDYGLKSPPHKLLCGDPGCGKSLCCKVAGSIYGVPVLRADAGRIMEGGHVGDAEGNLRKIIEVARAIGRCILWFDEADGMFAGMKSSGSTDGGTTMRCGKYLLQVMQDEPDIMFLFTANEIGDFPDALIDRMDLWSVTLPSMAERQAIWNIQIATQGKAKIKRDPAKFKVAEFAAASEGFSGRQILRSWDTALCVAHTAKREPIDADVLGVLKLQVPTSITMADSIAARKKRLAKARPASKPEAVKSLATVGRKLAA